MEGAAVVIVAGATGSPRRVTMVLCCQRRQVVVQQARLCVWCARCVVGSFALLMTHACVAVMQGLSMQLMPGVCRNLLIIWCAAMH